MLLSQPLSPPSLALYHFLDLAFSAFSTSSCASLFVLGGSDGYSLLAGAGCRDGGPPLRVRTSTREQSLVGEAASRYDGRTAQRKPAEHLLLVCVVVVCLSVVPLQRPSIVELDSSFGPALIRSNKHSPLLELGFCLALVEWQLLQLIEAVAEFLFLCPCSTVVLRFGLLQRGMIGKLARGIQGDKRERFLAATRDVAYLVDFSVSSPRRLQ